ncbi:hypothetical protein N0V90_004411 [Kalmusia sp. IMI 367209]|nr:hypothetical protein N0V90_004411 [Kalmusia sp. IMI 367209]
MEDLEDDLTTALLIATTSAQVPVKDGAAVVFGKSGTYPRAVRLADNSLLGVYTQNAGGNHTLTTVKSTDNGASWNPLGIVDTAPASSRDLDNPYVHQMPNGQVLCAFRNHDLGNGPNQDPTWYRITITVSDNLGQDWRFLTQAIEMPGGADGPWEPFMQTALDGSTQLYYSKETGPGGQDSIVRETTTNGQSWSAERVFTGADTNARDGMIGVAPVAPNSATKVAIFESGTDGHFIVQTVRTTTDGKTWEPTRYTVSSSPSSNAGAPQIIRVGSTLVASFGTNESGGTWPEGALALMVSRDGGKTWTDKTIVHALPAMWAGLIGAR